MSTDDVIGEIYGPDCDLDAMRAVANLCAASEKMLEALKTARHHIFGPVDERRDAAMLARKIDAAIAAAEPEADKP